MPISPGYIPDTQPVWGYGESGGAAGTYSSETPPQSQLTGSYLATVINVTDYGAKGDGATDDTNAIVNAVAAASDGDIVFFPRARYKFSTFTVAKGITLLGNGWRNFANAAFGSATWNNTAQYAGTVLQSTATSGSAITFSSGQVYSGMWLKNLMVLGPGSGTSVGVTIGSASVGVVDSGINNVLVANFATGYSLLFNEECSYYDIRARGCSTGLNLDQNTNQNVFVNVEVQMSTVDAVVLGKNATCDGNLFAGGLMQNCSGNGLHVHVGQLNRFETWWSENNTTFTCIQVDNSAGQFNAFDTIHGIVGPTNNVTVGGSNTSITNSNLNGTVTVTSVVSGAIFDNVQYNSLTDNGIATRVMVGGNYVSGGAPDLLGWGFPTTLPGGNLTGTSALTGANESWFSRVQGAGTVNNLEIVVATSSGNISVAHCRGAVGRSGPTTRVQTSGAVACPASGRAVIALGAASQVHAGDWFALSADNVSATFWANGGLVDSVTQGNGHVAFQSGAHPVPASPSTAGARGTLIINGA